MVEAILSVVVVVVLKSSSTTRRLLIPLLRLYYDYHYNIDEGVHHVVHDIVQEVDFVVVAADPICSLFHIGAARHAIPS